MGPNDYVLLELLDRLGGVHGRKKLQKLMYIAKLQGIPLEDEYCYHYYGPYSSELASRVDQLVERGLLAESTRPLGMTDGVEYRYALTEEAKAQLAAIRPRVPDDFRGRLARGIDAVAPLAQKNVFELELASTILYWHDKGHSWDEAEAITTQRKQADPTSRVFQQAREIARGVRRACA